MWQREVEGLVGRGRREYEGPDSSREALISISIFPNVFHFFKYDYEDIRKLYISPFIVQSWLSDHVAE